MKICKIFMSALLVFALASTQVLALAPSNVSDPDLDPTGRGIDVRSEISEPGAIAAGLGFARLAEGVERLSFDLLGDIDKDKLSDAVQDALTRAVMKRQEVPEDYSDAVDRAIENLVLLQMNLRERSHLFNAYIEGDEHYLLGFSSGKRFGLSVELIRELSPVRLSQYVFHECVPEDMVLVKIVRTDGRDAHRAIYNDIQSIIYGDEEVAGLKSDLRGFIGSALNPEKSGMPSVPDAESVSGKAPSILESAEIYIRRAAERIKLSPVLLNRMLKPKLVTEIKFSLKMDSGDTLTFWGFRALQNDARGPGKGGLRWLVGHGETPEEAKSTAIGLATLMTVKNGAVGIPFGGGKGDIFVPAHDYTANDKARIIREFAKGLTEKGAIGTFIDVPAPDRGTDADMMAYFMDEYLRSLATADKIYDRIILERLKSVTPQDDPKLTPYLDRYLEVLEEDVDGLRRGTELGMITGKPVNKGGSKGREKATGYGGYLFFKAMMERLRNASTTAPDPILDGLNPKTLKAIHKDIKDLTIGVQGFGNVGQHCVFSFNNAGAKVTILQDMNVSTGEITTIYHKDGIRLDLLEKYLRNEDGRWNMLGSLPKEFFEESGSITVDPEFFWKAHNDIKIPAAAENVITRQNAGDLNCEIVLELANNPTSPEADAVLRQRGILILPDVLANVGGVTVSYFEWIQNIEGRSWEEYSVDKMLEERINNEVELTLEIAKRYSVDIREAAFILSVARVANADIARSKAMQRRFEHRKPYDGYGELGVSPDTKEGLKYWQKRGLFKELVRREEKKHTDRIDSIVNDINNRFNGRDDVGYVLISGPRTSGKIELSDRIAGGLRSRGRRALTIDLDKNVDSYESRIPDRQYIPEDVLFDMKMAFAKAFLSSIEVSKGDIVIVEGDYALRSELAEALVGRKTFRIFANTAPSLKVTDNWPLTSLDLRLMRHILAMGSDRFRQDPLDIIQSWPKIRMHNLRYVYPSWRNADVTFDSYLAYELPVIKKRLAPILKETLKRATDSGDERAVQTIEHLMLILSDIHAVDADSFIPDDSIVRQYIGPKDGAAPSTVAADLPVRSSRFRTILKDATQEHAKKKIVLAVDSEIGSSGMQPTMLFKAMRDIKTMTDKNGDPLFPGLEIIQGKGGELAGRIDEMRREGLDLNDLFVVTRKSSVDSGIFDSIKGRSWIGGLDDSANEFNYMPIFEAATVTMMAALGSDQEALKAVVDAISERAVPIDLIEEYVRNRTIYILPKSIKADAAELRRLYERAYEIYTSA